MIQDANWISTSADIGEICPIFSKKIKINKTVKKSRYKHKCNGCL